MKRQTAIEFLKELREKAKKERIETAKKMAKYDGLVEDIPSPTSPKFRWYKNKSCYYAYGFRVTFYSWTMGEIKFEFLKYRLIFLFSRC